MFVSSLKPVLQVKSASITNISTVSLAEKPLPIKHIPLAPVPNLSFRANLGFQKSIDAILGNINKPILPQEKLERWLNQFEEQDKSTALKLVGAVKVHSYPDMMREMQELHGKVTERLEKDGFDTENFENVDFSRTFTGKSGDLVSYHYRKANKIRNTHFKNIDTLKNDPQSHKDKALVLLDDYNGTGGQFLVEFYARNPENRALLNGYKKIYYATITANERAMSRFDDIKNGNADKVSEEICADFADVSSFKDERKETFEAMRAIQGEKLDFIALEEEKALLSPENTDLSTEDKKEIKDFLLKYNPYKYPFGVGELQGHTSFYYSAPNTLPDLLWNSKIEKKGFEPLLHRVEDISLYNYAKFVPPDKQVW